MNTELITTLDIYWNGLKINGGKLLKVTYDMDNGAFCTHQLKEVPNQPVLLRRNHYYFSWPSLFTVSCDVATVEPESPLYPFVKLAYLKKEIHDIKKYMKHPVADDLELRAKQVALLEKQVKAMGRLKVTPSVLKKTSEYMEQLKADKKAKEEAEARAYWEEMRAKNNKVKAFGENLFNTLNAEYPIEKGNPWMEIPFSESYGIKNGVKLSLLAGHKFLSRMNVNFREVYGKDFGYDKTDFIVHFVDKKGKEVASLQDRYDVGSEHYSLMVNIASTMDDHYKNHSTEEGREMYHLFWEYGNKLDDKELKY